MPQIEYSVQKCIGRLQEPNLTNGQYFRANEHLQAPALKLKDQILINIKKCKKT